VILLDTNALIWLAQGHRRARPLVAFPRLLISPASLLEIQFLLEAGRLRFKDGRSADSLAADERWRLDEPPTAKWFTAACEFGGTRDPFDRLIAAHARVRRWKLATSDDRLLEHLAPSEVVAL
jgi:PIN domain nuclease of toxin-antitoxin system